MPRLGTIKTFVVANDCNHTNVPSGTKGKITDITFDGDEKVFKIRWMGYFCSLSYTRKEFSVMGKSDQIDYALEEQMRLKNHFETDSLKNRFVFKHDIEYDWMSHYVPICGVYEPLLNKDALKHHKESLDTAKVNEDESLIVQLQAVVYLLDCSVPEFGKRGTVVECVMVDRSLKFKVLWKGYNYPLFYFRNEFVLMSNGSKSKADSCVPIFRHYEYGTGLTAFDNSTSSPTRVFG